MKALVFHGKEDFRLEERAPASAGPGEVALDTAWCGCCGTDVHEWLAGPILIDPTMAGKLVLGHEFSGTVAQVGEGVKRVRVGDRVCVEPSMTDGSCYSCRKGHYNTCDNYGSFGIIGKQGGGFSERCVVREDMVHKLPANVSLEVGALVEPLAVAWHAVSLAKFQRGQTAFVAGSGPIGLAVLLVLQAWGAAGVTVSDPTAMRRSLAHKLGATTVYDPTETDVVRELRAQGGVDVAFECAGRQVSFDACFACTRPRGTVYNVAVWERKPEIDMNRLLLQEITLVGGIAYTAEDYKAVLAALESESLKPQGLITSRISLDDVVDKGFRELQHNMASHAKILVSPSILS